jgi:NAD(P)-dependent dehydrogenase (short-subunit alcohol dehydrogenase family)
VPFQHEGSAMASQGTILITGASRGIGAATARLAAARGYEVCFTYAAQHEAAGGVVAEIKALGRQAWCLQADAGDPAFADKVLEVNVLGLMLLTQQVVRRWREAGRGGSIVNVSSIAATLGAPGEYVHYAASKAAVEAFTVGLAKELAEYGIRVNAVSPGTTLTGIHAAAGEPGRPQRVAARIPMRRPGEAQEMAEAILWLLSSHASYATGTVLKVAGGL